MAATVLTHQDELARWHGIHADDCTSTGGCDHDAIRVPWLPGVSGCPNRLILADAFQAALRLWNLKTVAPLSDWPRGYSAWVQDGLEAIEHAIGERRLADMERAR